MQYYRSFQNRDDPHRGFSFPCNEKGEVNESKLNIAALLNYKLCLCGSVDGKKVIDLGVTTEG